MPHNTYEFTIHFAEGPDEFWEENPSITTVKELIEDMLDNQCLPVLEVTPVRKTIEYL